MIKKSSIIKKWTIINTIFIFLLGFVTHNLYKWFPSFLTHIFPVNESLYEHVKMIFITPIIYGIIWYFYLNLKNKKVNNYFFSFYLTTMINILIFYLIFLPIYYRFGENLLITLIIYFLSIFISQLINLRIIVNSKNHLFLNIIGIILLIINYIVLLYFTYYPIKNAFFFDTVSESYGINK